MSPAMRCQIMSRRPARCHEAAPWTLDSFAIKVAASNHIAILILESSVSLLIPQEFFKTTLGSNSMNTDKVGPVTPSVS